jgi:hypothetical protein
MTVGRIPVIEGGIQPTIFDAKGDLLTATANDTPARLAVGANDLLVTAASGEATGLKYTGGWQTWTPGYYTGISIGNGTLVSRFCKLGKNVFIYWKLTMGSTSTFGTSGASIDLPVTPLYPSRTSNVNYLDAGVQNYVGSASINAEFSLVGFQTGVVANNVSTTSPFTFGTGDEITLTGNYEVA